MKTQFKDIAHLYIGCKVEWKNEPAKRYTVSEFSLSDARYYLNKPDVKPILYPLSSLTEDQKYHIVNTRDVVYRGESASEFVVGWKAYTPNVFNYLLSQHFDLFGLIESGQAIDATTLNH